MLVYSLQPRYSSRQSFYDKAKVFISKDGAVVLVSYATVVAVCKDGKVYSRGSYSSTTTSHQKEFIKQCGFNADNNRDIDKNYGYYDEKFWDKYQKEYCKWRRER